MPVSNVHAERDVWLCLGLRVGVVGLCVIAFFGFEYTQLLEDLCSDAELHW